MNDGDAGRSQVQAPVQPQRRDHAGDRDSAADASSLITTHVSGRNLNGMTLRDRDREVLWSRAGTAALPAELSTVREDEARGGLTGIGEECRMIGPTPKWADGGRPGPRSGMTSNRPIEFAPDLSWIANWARAIDSTTNTREGP